MISGLTSLLRALGLLRAHPRLMLMLMLAPWTINLILFLGAWSLLTVWLTGQVDTYLAHNVEGWWQTLLVGFGNFVAVVVSGGLAYMVTIIGAVVVAAPFHDRLSAAAERAIRRPRAGDRELATEAAATGPGHLGWLGALREGGKTALVLLVAEILLIPLHFVPAVGPGLFAIASALVLTVGLLDVPLARWEMTLAAKRRFVRRRFGRVFGLSLVVLVVSMIPFVNLLCIPLIVIAATLLVVEAGDGEHPALPET